MTPCNYQKLFISPVDNSITLLGYKLSLTDSERAIVSLLSSEKEASFEQLRTLCGSSSVTVHICNINKKCREISERQMIVCDNGVYKLNDKL